MGKLFVGHYGNPPDAESATITLKDCHQRLGMKPSDFVSESEPPFFRKKHGAMGRYLVFLLEPQESATVWKAGYYLLPLEAADILKVFNKQQLVEGGAVKRPYQMECKEAPPPDVLKRAERWADESQPLLFDCKCPELTLRLDAPHLLRRTWRIRLSCPKRCMPALKAQI